MIREAVTAIFTSNDKIFVIDRQGYLPVFPGYTSFPGGKVDDKDSETPFEQECLKKFSPKIVHALIRELQEEINFDFLEALEAKKIKDICLLGRAITPDFNPYRFDTYFFKIELDGQLDFKADLGEAQNSKWVLASMILLLTSSSLIFLLLYSR